MRPKGVPATMFCVVPELLSMPEPAKFNTCDWLLIVNGLAVGTNTTLFTFVSSESDTAVILDCAKVAMSDGPLGIVGGDQFAAWFQSPVAGLVFHVALSAKVLLAVESRSSHIATVTNKNGNPRRGRGEGTASNIDEERRVMFFIIFPLV